MFVKHSIGKRESAIFQFWLYSDTEIGEYRWNISSWAEFLELRYNDLKQIFFDEIFLQHFSLMSDKWPSSTLQWKNSPLDRLIDASKSE